MVISWESLLLGLFLAFLPGGLLRNKEFRYLLFHEWAERRADKTHRRRRWWKTISVWLEPLRGYFAAHLLLSSLRVVPTEDPTAGCPPILPLAIVILLLTLAALPQMWSDSNRHCVIPAPYLGGVLLGALPLAVAIPALIIGVASTAAFRNWAAGLLIGAIFCVLIGYFFLGKSPLLAWSGIYFALPVIVAWLQQRKPVMAIRI